MTICEFISRLLFVSGVALAAPGGASADLIPAFDMSGSPTGNQASVDISLGNPFAVNSPILVSALGVYDSGGDGFTGTLQAVIYDTDSEDQVSSVLTFSGTAQTLIDGARYEDFSTPLLLNPGNYTIAAEGFSSTDPDGNVNCNGNFASGCLGTDVTASVTNTGGGLVTFLGPDTNGPTNGGLEFPNADANGGSDPGAYLAGTFEFEAAPSSAPEPMSAVLIAVGLLALSLMRRIQSGRGHTGAP